MAMKKIMLVFGTRPEAIKMAPLYHALKLDPKRFETIVCVTAQHRQMLDQVLKSFDIKVDVDLNLMREKQDLFEITSSVLLEMRDVLKRLQPDVLLVHGDTTTTLSSAIAGFYAGVPIGHIEAGLRTHDLSEPFPEEFNRQIASKVVKWHFAPTELSRQNLLEEGVSSNQITVTGNTVIDSLHWIINRIEGDEIRRNKISANLTNILSFEWKNNRFVLITGHRRENFGDGFMQICKSLSELAARYSDIHFVFPVHLNPNVQNPVNSMLKGLPNVHLISPLDYEAFVYLLKHCYLVLTDSGGIQEEAPSLGKPVLVMRNFTERPEAVKIGTVRLVGANRDSIIENVSELIENKDTYMKMSRAHNPYGDGTACLKIIDVLGKI
jgi:UDP-N-acetylglucosamine 2-epimerase (non-hydrolysing)